MHDFNELRLMINLRKSQRERAEIVHIREEDKEATEGKGGGGRGKKKKQGYT